MVQFFMDIIIVLHCNTMPHHINSYLRCITNFSSEFDFSNQYAAERDAKKAATKRGRGRPRKNPDARSVPKKMRTVKWRCPAAMRAHCLMLPTHQLLCNFLLCLYIFEISRSHYQWNSFHIVCFSLSCSPFLLLLAQTFREYVICKTFDILHTSFDRYFMIQAFWELKKSHFFLVCI